jgi:AraC-like DNA-binding protein
MSFTARRPASRLQAVIDRVWHIEDATPSTAVICPDGRTEIVLHLGDPMRGQHRHLLVAQMDRPITIVPSGRVAMVGARFRPGALHKVLPVAQDRLAGQILDLESIWQHWTRRAAERVTAVDDPDARLAVFEAMLEEIIPLETTRHADARLDAALVKLRATGGTARIDRLADEAGLSRRQFERRFRAYVGLAPRLFGRIVKFQRAFHLLGVDHGAAIAARCGYADQAHLVREVRRFGGQTPSVLAAADGLTAFFRG